ncbi:MAG: hypothetical protein GY856_00225, partial [bacterium]|nr:hypothetical protein [bacterium]
ELRRQWRMLAVFPGDFDAAGAGAVWELDAAAAEEVLDGELLRVSLVEHRDGRYRLQDLARDFAAERLEPGEVARRFRDVNG